jgi:hypothetical protein
MTRDPYESLYDWPELMPKPALTPDRMRNLAVRVVQGENNATTAIEAHSDATGRNLDDDEAKVVDLLVDLRLWAHRRDIDFDRLLRFSLTTYREEAVVLPK